MTWGPRELHPYVQDEDLLSSTQMRQGGDDTKWHVYVDGVYQIVVDLFNETFSAQLISSSSQSQADGVGDVEVARDDHSHAVYNMSGMQVQRLQKGINIVRTADGKVRKVLCK